MGAPPPLDSHPLGAVPHTPDARFLCDSGGVREQNHIRRRDPAWFWYAIAAGALVVLAILDATGVLDRLGP